MNVIWLLGDGASAIAGTLASVIGGTGVPVWSDALGLLWALTWDLGAVHP